MCGIAGFVGNGNKQHLTAMSNALIHRGPDGAGQFIDEPNSVYLGHRRLAILDIAGGEQPMWNEDGRIGVVFNGEIYNHIELKKELQTAGHVFRSDHADTEVLVHGYEEWGEDLPLRLNGMFAFVVYDRRRNQLFMACDRFGKKPLYYAVRTGVFCFASELTALLQHPTIERNIDNKSLQKYFAYGFIPAPNTLYERVEKLPGGYRLLFDLSSGSTTSTKYWQFTIEEPDKVPGNAEDVWSEELRDLLSQAVKRRMGSDAPLGFFLSGGLDSSAVLAFATHHMQGAQASTFSIGFTESSFDESFYAKRVAELFGSNHHHKMLSIDSARDLIPEILGKLDEPMGDSSILPTYLLSQFARRYVKVALGGDGADEIFAGYDPIKALQLAQKYRQIVPTWLHGGVRRLVDLLPASEKNLSFDFKIKRALRGVSYSENLWNPVWLGALEAKELQELFNQPVDVAELYEEAIAAWDNSNAGNIVDKSLEFYTRFYLQENVLTKVDRASMMASLEVRAPFLDNDLVDFARKIPHQYKYRSGQTKYLLKRAMEPMLPHNIIHRKKKGFGVPLTRWLKELAEPTITLQSPVPNANWVHHKWLEHQQGKADHRLFMWNWLVLQHHLKQAHGRQ